MKVFNQLELILQRRKRKRLPKPAKIREPKRIEREYQRELVKILEDINKAFEEILLPNLDRIVAEKDTQTPLELRKDAPEDSLDDLVRLIGVRVTQEHSNEAIERLALKYGLETSKHNREELQKSLRRVVGVDIMTPDLGLTQKLSGFAVTNVHLIKSMRDEALNRMETIALTGLANGERAETISKNIKKYINPKVGNVRARADLIARDQISKLNGQLNMTRQSELGVKRYVWSTSGDERVRDTHSALDGQTFSWDDPPISNVNGDRNHPGGDPQCLPGSSFFALDQSVNTLFRRRYTGELTKIVSDSFECIEATPNHPILTNTGWKALKDVDIGDYVFSVGNEAFSTLKSDVKKMEARLHDLFDSFRVFFGVSASPSVETDFHGDSIIDNEINIINVNPSLGCYFASMCFEDIVKLGLTNAHAPSFCVGKVNQMFSFKFDSPASIIGGLSKIHSFLLSHAFHSDFIGFASVSSWDFFLNKPSLNNISTDTVLIRDRQFAHAVNIVFNCLLVYFHYVVRLPAFTSGFKTISDTSLSNALSVDAQDFTNGSKTIPFGVQPKRIIDKSFSVYDSHVYNLQTETGWYLSNNVIMHNCRCVALPVLDDIQE